MGLLDSHWQTTISKRHLPLWQDKREAVRRSRGESEPVVSELILQKCDWSRYDWSKFSFCGNEDQFLRLLVTAQIKMAGANYSVTDMARYWEWVWTKLNSPTRFDYFAHSLFWKVWNAAEQETAANRKAGTFAGPSSLGLLKVKTVAAIKALAVKIKEDGWEALFRWEPSFSLGA